MPSGTDFAPLLVEIRSEGKVVDIADRLLGLTVRRWVNRIPEAQLRLVDGSVATEDFGMSESAQFAPGAKLEIRLGYGSDASRVFQGIVVALAIEIDGAEGPTLVVRCRDEAMKMTVGRRTEVFSGKGVAEVLSRYGAESKGGGSAEAQTVQAFATDWDFVVASAESIGHIVLCQDGAVTVVPPELDSSGADEIVFGQDIVAFNAALDAMDQWKQVTTKAWDHKSQALLEATAAAAKVAHAGDLEDADLFKVASPDAIQLATSAPLEAESLKSWADGRMVRSRLARLRGSIRVMGDANYAPNQWIRLAGLGQRFNGPAYVSGVEHTLEANAWHTDLSLGLAQQLFVERVDATAPAASALLPAVHGLHTATVVKLVEDPAGQHRILVSVPVFADGAGKGELWARWLQPYASSAGGICFPPEKDDEVLVGFLHSDPRFPVVLGGLYSGRHTPPTEIGEPNNHKAIVSRGKLKIRFDDEKKSVTVETPGGNTVTLDDDQKCVTITDQHSNKILMSQDGITIKSASALKIEAATTLSLKGATVAIEADQSVDVKATSTSIESTTSTSIKGTTGLDLKGMNVKVAADMQLDLSGGLAGKVSGGLDLALSAALVRIN